MYVQANAASQDFISSGGEGDEGYRTKKKKKETTKVSRNFGTQLSHSPSVTLFFLSLLVRGAAKWPTAGRAVAGGV